MGKKDLWQSDYFDKNERFADIFNGALFGGKAVINDEFLSGIKKEDKFVPIITLVLYLGNDKAWDGAESLHEMLDMEDNLKAFVPDYRINVFDYHKYSDFSNFGQENRLLFELLSASDDETKMSETLDKNQELCNRMDRDSINAILGIAGIHANLEDIKQYENGRETYNMCKAFDDHKQTGYREGKRDGFNSCKISVIENMLRQNIADELIMTIAECTQEVVDEARKKISS